MQTQFSENSTYPIIRAVLSDADRAEALIRLWEKQEGRSNEDWQVLQAASLIMTGVELPSPAAALSVSAGFARTQVWEGLVYLALALGRLDAPESLPPVFAPIVCDALKAASQKLAAFGDGIHLNRPER